jgi:hypothetical protein
MSHTPAPWKSSDAKSIVLCGERIPTIEIGSPVRAFWIAQVQVDSAAGEADATPIAAAPELLEALKNCVDGLGCQPGYVGTLALSRARAAIAKAEGRP